MLILSQKARYVEQQWQNNGKRFRIIPETKDGINNNSRKMDWPSLYLGLSRLYPVGEVIDAKLKVKNLDLQKEQEYFIKKLCRYFKS